MYEFVDTTQTAAADGLPPEALQINGEYIENLIDGYRTLTVSGRELLEADITERDIESVNGSEYLYKRYPTRDIDVTFQLLASSSSELATKCNQLNKILNTENATLIFADETDKYFIGTPSDVSLPEDGLCNITASFTLHCSDPFKYAVDRKEFTASADENSVYSMMIENDGAVAVPIDYEITMNHDNGFIGIVSEYGAMQYGSAEEVDGQTANKSEMLLDYPNYTDLSALSSGGGTFDGTNKWNTNGTWKKTTINNVDYLTVDNVGSGSSWHGASKCIAIPEASDGTTTSDFYTEARYYFATITHKSQTGLMEFVIADTDGNNLASIHIVKASTTNNSATVVFQIGGKEVGRTTFEPTYKGVGGDGGKPMYIRKSSELFEFCWNNKKYQYRKSEYADKTASTLTLFVGQHGTRGNGATALVGRMGIRAVKFRKDDVEYWDDIPNRYASGDVVRISGQDAKIYVNDIASLGDEILGTSYFHAGKGETKIEFVFSDWSTPLPTVKAYIREAWI